MSVYRRFKNQLRQVRHHWKMLLVAGAVGFYAGGGVDKYLKPHDGQEIEYGAITEPRIEQPIYEKGLQPASEKKQQENSELEKMLKSVD